MRVRPIRVMTGCFARVDNLWELGSRGRLALPCRPLRMTWATGAAGMYSPWMLPWSEVIDPVADQDQFAGVVSVHRGGDTEFARAYGLADRAHEIPNTVGTRFAIASGTKGLTALVVVSLINDNALAMSTTARSVLGADLPLIGDDVTVEHLLAHRSGIGDYLDEEAGYDVTDYLLTVPPQDLASTERYLAVLGGHPAKFRAGERFSYCNSGYVVLALIAERVSGVAFDQLVAERVCGPAGMADTGFLRSDELPAAPRWVTWPSRAVPGRTCSTCR